MLFEVARLDLPDERRVDRQLGRRAWRPRRGRPASSRRRCFFSRSCCVGEALPVLVRRCSRPATPATAATSSTAAVQNASRPISFFLASHHDLPCDSRIRTGASASVTSAPSDDETERRERQAQQLGGDGPRDAPGTRPSAVRRSPPVRIAHAPATSAARSGRPPAATRRGAPAPGAPSATRARTRSSPSAGGASSGAARERALEATRAPAETRAHAAHSRTCAAERLALGRRRPRRSAARGASPGDGCVIAPLLCAAAERLAQRQHGAVEARLQRSLRRAGHLGDLGEGELAAAAQHHDLPHVVGQLDERARERARLPLVVEPRRERAARPPSRRAGPSRPRRARRGASRWRLRASSLRAVLSAIA